MSGLATSMATEAGLESEVEALRAERDQLRAIVLVLSDSVDRARAIGQADARAIAVEAYFDGERAGYERGARMLADTWPALVAGLTSSYVTHADLEARRYGPGGRAHAGVPRPGDHGPFTPEDIEAIRQRWEGGR